MDAELCIAVIGTAPGRYLWFLIGTPGGGLIFRVIPAWLELRFKFDANAALHRENRKSAEMQLICFPLRSKYNAQFCAVIRLMQSIPASFNHTEILGYGAKPRKHYYIFKRVIFLKFSLVNDDMVPSPISLVLSRFTWKSSRWK